MTKWEELERRLAEVEDWRRAHIAASLPFTGNCEECPLPAKDPTACVDCEFNPDTAATDADACTHCTYKDYYKNEGNEAIVAALCNAEHQCEKLERERNDFERRWRRCQEVLVAANAETKALEHKREECENRLSIVQGALLKAHVEIEELRANRDRADEPSAEDLLIVGIDLLADAHCDECFALDDCTIRATDDKRPADCLLTIRAALIKKAKDGTPDKG